MPFEQELLDVILDHLPKQTILARYDSGRGKELASGKFMNPASSSALVANAFGIFLSEPGLLQIPAVTDVYGHATTVDLEKELRFPWRGGLHPWLDVVAQTKTHLIGIESKRYEPFREKKSLFSEAFERPVWGEQMKPFESLRDELNGGFLHLDPVQLTKHAFALRTQAFKKGQHAVLLYLYAEPSFFSNGDPVHQSAKDRHRVEVKRFATAVSGAEVSFYALTYRNLIDFWSNQPLHQLGEHAALLSGRYPDL